LATTSLAVANGCESAPTPYEASYLLTRKGKPAGSMRVVLERKSTGAFSYRMDTQVKWGLIRPRVLQSSEFTWENGHVSPVRFQSTQKISLYKRQEFVDFNWKNMKATGRKKRVDFELDIQAGMQDKLSIYFLLARKLCNGEKTIDANVVSGPVLKSYSYRFQAEEVLDTELGRLQAIHLRRGTPGSEKQTDIWHAEEIRYLPVRLVYRKKSDVTTMELSEISFSKDSDTFRYNPDEKQAKVVNHEHH